VQRDDLLRPYAAELGDAVLAELAERDAVRHRRAAELRRPR
jgi:hypothetical protein